MFLKYGLEYLQNSIKGARRHVFDGLSGMQQGLSNQSASGMKEQMTLPTEKHTLYFDVAANIWGAKDVFVNMYFVKSDQDASWVLIDAGLKSSGARIKKIASILFPDHPTPAAILLTHGHFDHTGALKELANEWNVPVYCHYLELPYLSGKSDYPPPDATVDHGFMARMAWMYPKKAIDVSSHLQILPPDGSVPHLPGWNYLYTPGHAPGHVSFFRQRGRVLIAGDAIVTTIQESVLSVLTQKKVLSGPPKYFTYDWEAAHNSVRHIADLDPDVIASGHGKPLYGTDMQAALYNLSRHFERLAVPKKGRYVHQAAVVDAHGVMYVPPKTKRFPLLLAVASVSVLAAITTIAVLGAHKPRRRP